MNTSDRIVAICQEADMAGKRSAACYIGEETAVVVVQNPERVTPREGELVPGFYVAKYHRGNLVSESFI